MDKIKPTLKLMAKHDFDIVKFKYNINGVSHQKIIDKAKPLDVLAFQVLPASKLKIINVMILNEETFLECLVNGFFKS